MPALAALAMINAATWATYSNDKRAAASSRQRTRESTLHVLELLGGWPAAWLAQEKLRHKSRKPSFRWTYLLMAGLNFAMVGGWLLVSRPAW